MNHTSVFCFQSDLLLVQYFRGTDVFVGQCSYTSAESDLMYRHMFEWVENDSIRYDLYTRLTK